MKYIITVHHDELKNFAVVQTFAKKQIYILIGQSPDRNHRDTDVFQITMVILFLQEKVKVIFIAAQIYLIFLLQHEKYLLLDYVYTHRISIMSDY